MEDSEVKIAMLEMQIKDMEQAKAMQRSQLQSIFLDLKVMIEEGDYEEALEMLIELTE